jgi:hypothetical protein
VNIDRLKGTERALIEMSKNCICRIEQEHASLKKLDVSGGLARAGRKEHLAATCRWEFKYRKEDLFIQKFDFYISPQKLTLGLFVRMGAGLPALDRPHPMGF